MKLRIIISGFLAFYWSNISRVQVVNCKKSQSFNAGIQPGTCDSNSCLTISQDSGNIKPYFTFPGDNTRFCTCINGKAYEMKCPSGNVWRMDALGCLHALIYSHGNSQRIQEETEISSGDDEPLPEQIPGPEIQPDGGNHYGTVERRRRNLLTNLILTAPLPLPLPEPMVLNIEPKKSFRKHLTFKHAIIAVAIGVALLGCFSICASFTLSGIYRRKG